MICLCRNVHSSVCVCVCPHQSVHLHQFLVLLVELAGFDLQNHSQALQLLLQIHHVRVPLWTERTKTRRLIIYVNLSAGLGFAAVPLSAIRGHQHRQIRS